MSTNKAIEIEYISEKLKESPVITLIDDVIILDSSTDILDIKKSVIGILDCTNIKEQVEKNNVWRHIYKLDKEISKHILSTISKSLEIIERKIIIKNVMKDILHNQSVIIIHWWSIYINDTWIEKNKVTIKVDNVNIEENRYNWYNENELNELIQEYLSNNKDTQWLINNIVSQINFKSLNLKEITSFLTSWYKSFILTNFSEQIKNKYNLNDEISSAFSWKIIRDNFTLISIKFYQEFYKQLLKNKASEKWSTYIQKWSKNVNTKFLDLNNSKIGKNIWENIFNLNIYIEDEIKKELTLFINELYLFEWKISNIWIKTFSKILISPNIKEAKINIIEELITDLINIIKSDSAKLPTTLVEFLKYLSIQDIEIKVSYMENYLNSLKISSDLKTLLYSSSKIEKDLKLKNEKLKTLKESISKKIKFRRAKELQVQSNSMDIRKFLSKILYKWDIDKEITFLEILSDNKKSTQKRIQIEHSIKSLNSNKIKSVINSKKISELQLSLVRYKKRIHYTEEIIDLYKKNKSLKIELKNIEEVQLNINNIQKWIKFQNDELKIYTDKIDQIKAWLIRVLSK